MSATTRSSSSSPDILGPPGDADYLISSPIKPFTGRQSVYSPAVTARRQTPARGTPAKRPRVSLSPAKSAHSIRFDDVLLPGSPTMKLEGRQRSLSPLKDQQDGNVSPWRIRVTLEATQDEENQGEMQASPSRKRRRPSTVTTKIPLKDDRSPLAEKTPSRPRGRPRKSDTKPLNGSPWPAASPGNTPGRPGATPMRKRGRPPKGTPRPSLQEIHVDEDETTPAPVSQPIPSLETEPEPEQHTSPMDIAPDGATEPLQRMSPVNIAGNDGFDSDSLGADDLPIADLTGPFQAYGEISNGSANRGYGRATYDTPIIGASEHHFLDNEENIHSTPSKMPSPTRERRSSSVRSVREAPVPSAPSSTRTYPTPTPTSSLAEEENQARGAPTNLEPEHYHKPQSDPFMEPTDDHEEFDSIMESEGFTMVSLDTLPSAQQIGLGSHASRASDNAAKVLQDRDNGKIGDRLKRKLPGGITDLRSEHSSARASPAVKEFSPGSLLRSRQEGNRSVKPPPANDSPKRQFSSPIGRQSKNAGKPSPQPVSYPDLPPTSSPAKHRPSYRSEEQYEDEEEGDEGQYEGEDDEGVFEDFAPKNEAVVLDDIEEEEEDVEEVDVNEEEDNEEEDNEEEVHIVPHSSEFEQAQSPRDQAFSARSQQEARWHEERLNVSRHAQNAADSNRMIYIDSDENVSDEERIQSNDLAHDRWQSDVESVVDEEVEQPEEPEEPEELDEPEDIAGHEDREQSEGPEGLGPDDEPATLSEQDVPEDIERFKEEDLDGFGESDQDRQSKTKPVPSTFIDQNRTVQREASEDVDDGYDDIWRQEPENSRSEHRQAREPEQPANRAWATEYDEDDAFDDIWQQEARDNSYLSQQSDHRAHQPVEEAVSPWREIAEDSSNQNRLGSSPAYVNLEKYDLRHLNPTQIRKLREREVDLSALLAADDTPNRARYYNGTSTPRSILSRHSAAQHSSASKSSSHKPEKRVRLQPLSQSPEREPEAEQESPVFRHNYSRQESLPDEVHEIGSASDGGSFEDEPAEGMTTTPRRQSQPDVEPQGSTWFQRITSLTPRWLKAPNQADDDESSEASQDEHVEASDEETEDDQVDKGELSLQSPQEHHQSHEDTPRSHRSSESPFVYQKTPASAKPANSRQRYETSQVRSLEADDEASDDFERRASGDAADELVGLDEEAHDRPKGPRPLAVFGYFSNEHYLALRRIYRMAKRHPGRLPYHNAPGRAQIIGDWIWTSDGLHGVPISEAQFAIIDRFVQELSHADVQYGGSGQVEWTDADLHRRLISIIIGEQIREERKVQANRGASVDTWR